MAKKKSYADVKESLKKLKEDAKTARGELNAFCKENGLSKDEDHSNHTKFGKKYTKLKSQYEKLKKERDETEKWLEDNKDKKERKPRGNSKYEYPADCVTAADKKKFRAKMRAAAKSAEKKKNKEEKADKGGKENPKKNKNEKGSAKGNKKEKTAAPKKEKAEAED